MDPTTAAATFTTMSDITDQLLHRYSKSSAPQHRHLLATASATRSILLSSSLPLTPTSYSLATLSTLASAPSLDAPALSALSSLLSITLPLVNDNSINCEKASEGVEVLVGVLDSGGGEEEVVLGASSVRALVKCLGVLVGFCDLGDWDCVKLGFGILVKYSIDKRPKVRKCSQDCLLMILKSIASSSVSKRASESIYSLFKDHISLAIRMNILTPSEVPDVDILSKPEHQEVLHVFNVLKSVIPHLSPKTCSRILSELLELVTREFSAMTRHIFEIIGILIDTLSTEVIAADAESVILMLVTYISHGHKNPIDTVLHAANLAKQVFEKLHGSKTVEFISHLPSVIESVAGLLVFEASIALQASNILKEIINSHLDTGDVSISSNGASQDESICNNEVVLVKATCSIFENMLTAVDVVSNEHIFTVISVLFLKLGRISDIYMKGILLKLSDLMTDASVPPSNKKHVEDCIGSAIVAMGPEKLLSILPISLTEDLSCSNAWLIPLLRTSIVGSSLRFYVNNVFPLAKSLQQASRKEKKSVIGKGLKAHARCLWGLLPAFCRHPIDIANSFEDLVKILVRFLQKNLFMVENVAIALQELVNQNRGVLTLRQDPQSCKELPMVGGKPSYSRKTAAKNLKALASFSGELLQALIDILFDSPPASHQNLKDAIQCLASISESLVTKKLFVSFLKRLQLIKNHSESEASEFCINWTSCEEENDGIPVAKRLLILELASSFVEGADEDLMNLLFDIAKQVLEADDKIAHVEAYKILSKLLERHSLFCSERFDGFVDILLGTKDTEDLPSLKGRLACIQKLLILGLQENLDEENAKAFVILNEIILLSKDSKDEARKAAYDAIIGISSTLRSSSCAAADAAYHKLVTMVMAYLSGSSPHIKSGAVSALSILIYSDGDISVAMPDLVPSVLTLLQLKDTEIIKAVLGFIKVLVSTLETRDLLKFASDIVDGILPWSSMSRHHLRSKV
ncbi:hypothetical protein Leryth_001137 [Lithospermum erythrorhizon]|nr:hypothetical protein Leryth_001137 [Lithospermum erythrorhizon]